MFNIFKTIFSDENEKYSFDKIRTSGIYSSLFFSLLALILSIMNIINKSYIMLTATSVITVGFLIASFLFKKNKILAARIVIGLLCASAFSMFAISGGNDGFAILWIIMIPLISSFLLGLKLGFFLDIYFQLFLFVLFYTPLRQFMMDYYTVTFMNRFPLLYFTSFGAVTIIVCQRQELNNEINKKSYTDDLTGLYNRRHFNEVRKEKAKGNLTILSFDLNRLKYVNDNIGHDVGDEMIKDAAMLLKEAFSEDICCRTGGDEFIIISYREKEEVIASLDKFKESADNHVNDLYGKIFISSGYASNKDHPEMKFKELLSLSDKNMYADKAFYYQTNNIERRRQ